MSDIKRCRRYVKIGTPIAPECDPGVDDAEHVAALLAEGGFPSFEEDERGFLKRGWIYPKRQRLAA